MPKVLFSGNSGLTLHSFYGLITAGISGYTSSSIADIIAHNPFITFDDLSHAAAIATLFAGWGNVIFMPMSNSPFNFLLEIPLLTLAQSWGDVLSIFFR